MPVYRFYGFRWPRGGQGPQGEPGIRVHIAIEILDEATAEYIQQKQTSAIMLASFKLRFPEIITRLQDLEFIEEYDPEDESAEAVSKPYAYVAHRVTTVQDSYRPRNSLGEKVELSQGPDFPDITPEASRALSELRDLIAPGAEICWYLVYNGDPERSYPGYEMEDFEDQVNPVLANSTKEPPQSSVSSDLSYSRQISPV